MPLCLSYTPCSIYDNTRMNPKKPTWISVGLYACLEVLIIPRANYSSVM